MRAGKFVRSGNAVHQRGIYPWNQAVLTKEIESGQMKEGQMKEGNGIKLVLRATKEGQTRDNALEAARVAPRELRDLEKFNSNVNNISCERLATNEQEAYRSRIHIYPHQILKEHKVLGKRE